MSRHEVHSMNTQTLQNANIYPKTKATFKQNTMLKIQEL